MEENIIKLAFSADSIEKRKYFNEIVSSYKCQNKENSSILASIDKIFYEVNNVDVIIIARGGGSFEDLFGSDDTEEDSLENFMKKKLNE